MYELKQKLLLCGYKGPCKNLEFLRWAIRAGASSQIFLNLISWLEEQLQEIDSVQQVRDNINRLFGMLRLSILMIPSCGSEAAINPKEFRLQTLKVLVQQLRLRRLPKHTPKFEIKTFQRDCEKSVQNIKGLTITLYLNEMSKIGDRNQRLVRYSQNVLEMKRVNLC